jgi:hypothetical protein
MPSGLSNQPRLLRGALVDVNALALPPVIVPFQFNPESIQRRRSARVSGLPSLEGRGQEARQDEAMGEGQQTSVDPETLSMDIRLDATDQLERGDQRATRLGVLPSLSALELMIIPRSESLFAGRLSVDFGFGARQETPVLIFVWGRQRIYAVRLTDMTINEQEFNAELCPTRVTANVSMQVLEGPNPFFIQMQTLREDLVSVATSGLRLITRLV